VETENCLSELKSGSSSIAVAALVPTPKALLALMIKLKLAFDSFGVAAVAVEVA